MAASITIRINMLNGSTFEMEDISTNMRVIELKNLFCRTFPEFIRTFIPEDQTIFQIIARLELVFLDETRPVHLLNDRTLSSYNIRNLQEITLVVNDKEVPLTLDLVDEAAEILSTMSPDAHDRVVDLLQHVTHFSLFIKITRGRAMLLTFLDILPRLPNLISISSTNTTNPNVKACFGKLIEIIPQCQKLTILNLSHCKIGNSEAKALAPALANCRQLTSLNLFDNEIGDEGVVALAPALENCSELTSLNLSENKIGFVGASSLSVCTRLTVLNLEDNQIGEEIDSFVFSPSLEEINLSRNMINYSDAVVLAQALQQCNYLTVLNLSDNEIGDAGASELAKVVHYFSKLDTLTLYGNKIGDSGIIALAEQINHCPSLRVLQLSINNIDNAGTIALTQALVDSRVQELELDRNKIGDEGAIALARLLSSGRTNLNKLMISENQIDDEGAAALYEIIKNRIINSIHFERQLKRTFGSKRRSCRSCGRRRRSRSRSNRRRSHRRSRSRTLRRSRK